MYSYRMIYLIMSQKLNNSLRDFIIFSSERERELYMYIVHAVPV